MADTPAWLSEYPEVQDDSWLSQYKEVEETPFLDLTETASALGRAATSLPTTTMASLSQAWEGLNNPWKRSEGYLARRQEMQALQDELAASEAEAAASGDISSVSSAIREATPSLGFSGATLFPSLGVGVGALALSKSPAAARGAAAATSSLMAYRMAGAQFLDDARDRIDNYFQENLGRLPTEKEQEEAYQELLPLARKFGAAEAGPEALGNLALGGAGKYIRRVIGGKGGVMELASNALGKVTGTKAALAGAGAIASEIATEAVTGVEQNRIQRQLEEGVMRGESPESVAMADRSLQDYLESFKEVAPATIATTGMLGAIGLGPTAVSRGIRAIRKPSEQAVVETVPTTPEAAEAAPAPTPVDTQLETAISLAETAAANPNAQQSAAMSAQVIEQAARALPPSSATEMPEKPSQTIIGSNGEIAPEMPVQPMAGEALLSEGAERNRAVIAEAAAKLRGQAPQDISAGLQAAIPPSLPETGPPVVDQEAPAGTPVQAASIESIELPTDSSDAIKGIVKRHDSLFKNLRNAGVDIRLSRPSEAAETKGVFWVNETDEGKLELVLDEKNAEKTEAVGLTDQAIFHETVHAAQALFDRDNQFLSTQADKVFDPNSAEFDQELDSFMANEVPSWGKIRGTRNAKYEAVRALLEAKHLNKTSRSFRPGMPFVRYLSQFIEWAKANVFSFGTAKNKRFSLYVTKIDRLLNSILQAAPIQPVETQEDAIPQQIPDEGVLRQERPEMELQAVGEGNIQPEEVAREGEIQEGSIEKTTEELRSKLASMPQKADRDSEVGTLSINEANRAAEYGSLSREGRDLNNEYVIWANPFSEEAFAYRKSNGDVAYKAKLTDLQSKVEDWKKKASEARFIRQRTELRDRINEAKPAPQISRESKTTERVPLDGMLPPVDLGSPSSAAQEEVITPQREPTTATEGMVTPGGVATERDIETGAPKLDPKNDSFASNLASRAWRIAAGMQWDDNAGDWVHPNYPGRSRSVVESEITESNPPPKADVQRVFNELAKSYGREDLIKGEKTTKHDAKDFIQVGRFVKVGYRVPIYEKGEVVGGKTNKVVGNITRIMPDGKVEVRLNQGGFKVLPPSEIEDAPTHVGNKPLSTQTTAAETQTPVPLREGTGAAGVARTSLEGGRSSELPQVSPETETTSTEKADVVSAAMADLNGKILELPESAQKKWTPEVLQKAQDYYASTDRSWSRLDGLTQTQKEKIQDALYRADKEEAKRQREVERAQKAITREMAKVEREEKKREEEMLRREEMRSKALDSIIGNSEKKDREFGQVQVADAAQAMAMLQNSGEVPGVLTAWVGNSKDFLADPQNEQIDPEVYNRVKRSGPDEGLFNKGRVYIFLDGIGVSEKDRLRGENLNISPQVAAVRRVLLHESLVHKGIHGLPLRHRRLILNWVKQNATPEDLDKLAELYTEYRNWRTSTFQFEALAEEYLAKQVDQLTELPKDGPMARLMDILRQIWEYIVGYKKEPTLTDLKSVVKLLKSGAQAVANDRLKDGGGVKLSYAGEKAIENLPEERRQFMRDSLETAKAMAAAGKSSEEIRAVTGWFPGKYDGKMRWEVPDEGASLRLDAYRKERNEGSSPEEIVRGFFARKQADEQRSALALVRGLPKDELLKFSREFTERQKQENANLYAFFVRGDNKDRGRIPMGFLLDHPALFESYPDLWWTPISFNAEDVGFESAGQANADGSIGLNPVVSFEDENQTLSTLLHEIQHLIQNKEGFAKGSSVERAAGRQGWDYYDEGQAIRDYQRTAGEIEARDVQARQKLTPEQRKATAPYSSENIAPEDAIVMFGGGGAQMSMATPEMDAEYLAAVEAGDMATAQKMVDEAARAAGYERKLFHGTTETKTKITPGKPAGLGYEEAVEGLKKIAEKFGVSEWSYIDAYPRMLAANYGGITQADVDESIRLKKQYVRSIEKSTPDSLEERIGFDVFNLPTGELELGVHLGNKSAAALFGTVFPFWTKLGKQLRLPDLGTWNYQSVMRELRKRGVEISESDYDKVFYSTDPNGELRNLIQSRGIDSIVYKNEAEGRGDSFIALSPSQIKSADAVTRDDQGNVIPLSQRFQPTSSDIRFSKVDFSTPSDALLNTGSEVSRDTLYDSRIIGIRNAIRQAYDAMPKTNSVAVPIGELLSKTQEFAPDVTADEFSNVLQDMFEDNGAVLQEGNVVEPLPEQDRRYLALAQDEEANREELQRMVDEAAKAAGFNVGPVWHGTTRQFNVFRASKMGELGPGIYTTTDEDMATSTYTIERQSTDGGSPHVKKLHLSLSNPVFVPSGKEAYEVLSESGWSDNWSVANRQMVKLGHDGIIQEFPDGTKDLVVFSPNQIKSADPVTRDDQGHIIPLSSRFDTGADIRGQINVTTPEGKRAGFVVVMPSQSPSVESVLRGMASGQPAQQPINQDKYDTALALISDFTTGKRTIKFPRKLAPATGARTGDVAAYSPITGRAGEAATVASDQAGVAGAAARDGEVLAGDGQVFDPYSVRDFVETATRIGVDDVRIDSSTQYGASALASQDGVIQIRINPERMAESIARSDGDSEEILGAALNEELIHAADLVAARTQWNETNRRQSFDEFVKDQDIKTVNEMIQVARSSNNPEETTRVLFDAISSSINLYGGTDITSLDAVENFLKASDHDTVSAVMGEFVRQMIQSGLYKTVSEVSLFRRFIDRVKQLVRRVAAAFTPAKGGQYGEMIRSRLNEIEGILDFASRSTGIKASKVDPENAAAKRLKEDADAASAGSVRANFGGVPFKNYEGTSHVTKTKKSYEEAAVRFVDDLVDQGISIDDIADSVMSPAFLERVGIKDDLAMINSVVFETRNRIVNTMRKTRDAALRKRLERKHDDISAFSQGVRSTQGQNFALLQQLMQSPRYRWQFIYEMARKQQKQDVQNVVAQNVTNPDELKAGVDADAQASADAATEQNVQAAENATGTQEDVDDDADLRAGEATLSEKLKQMYEELKDWLRTKGIIARARAERAANAAKPSISAERRSAIMSMTDEELDALDKEADKNIDRILKTILGKEEDAKTPEQKVTRQKRKKMVDVAKKRAEKGKPVDPAEAEEAAIEIAENKASQIVYRFEELYRQGFKNPPEGMSKKEQKDSIIRAFRDQVRNPVSFEQFAERLSNLKVGDEVAERMFLTASRERADLIRVKQFRIDKRRVEIANKQASRLIYSTEERLRQGSKDLETSKDGDSINRAFREQVSDPMSQDDFVKRLAKLNVSADVANRLFKTAAREKTDLEAMKAYELLEGPDALARMLRELNRARPGEQAPLSRQIPWRTILSQKASTVAEYRQRIFDVVSSNEAFANLTDEQKQQITDLFAQAWEQNRTRILDSMLENRIRQEQARNNLTKAGAEALQKQRMKLVEDLNLGILDNEQLMLRLAEKFGVKAEYTEQEREQIDKLLDILQDENTNAALRASTASKLLSILSDVTKVPIAKIIADFWVTSVLSGFNTIFSIGAAVASGAFELLSGFSRVIRTGFQNPQEVPGAIIDSFKAFRNMLAAFPMAARSSWQYLVTGDRLFLDPSMNDITTDLNYEQIGRTTALAENLAKSENKLAKVVGLYMRTVSRLLTALDNFNSTSTKFGSLPIVFRSLKLTPEKLAQIQEKNNLQMYIERVIRNDFNGVQPKNMRERATVEAYARAEMMKDLDELGRVSENADFYGMQGAMTLDPTGIGGAIYKGLRDFTGGMSKSADNYIANAKRRWQIKEDPVLDFINLASAYFMQFIAYNASNMAGFRFARFAGNKFNQGLSFIPGIGMLRKFEADSEKNPIRGKEAFIDMIDRNQMAGMALAVIGYVLLEAIADEPDDEKRGWAINGGWGNLTPEKKKQLLAAGMKEYTIRIGDKVYNYINWPISSALAAIGGLSDLIRFSPEAWGEKDVVSRLGTAAASGIFAATDIPALSTVQELFGSNLSSKDPVANKLDRLARVMSGYAGGFVPRILKDFDYLAEPGLRKYKTLWEKTASHIPVYRRHVGEEYYDILGRQIERKVYPGSREFLAQPTEPEYRILGALNSRGIWLTPANAEHRMVGRGSRKRNLTQEEADAYSLETGRGYRQMLLKYGQRALRMPPERAQAFLQDLADDVRDRALMRVYRGYRPAE